ncbi:hypothetical protein [Novosphingobium sp. P6W]|uniref:hypothetical protein n=1 Tax=Novosphingobium sp. P6W TaxID=1609758 RepID=UPI0013B45726|nr:hypothetical protein [Novosphingobium sp. P6W]
MAFGYENWKNTTAGIETGCVIRLKASEIISAAQSGQPPVRVIAADIRQHLGTQQNNAFIGRMIREWLGPTFRVTGREKWQREDGTESGAVYDQAA